MRHFTEEELDKLPKWARSRAEAMNADIDAAQRQVDAFSGKEESRVRLWGGRILHGHDFYIPERQQIEFVTGEGSHPQAISVSLQGPEYGIESRFVYVSGMTQIHVLPGASNTVKIF